MVVVSWYPSTDPDGIQFYRIYRDGTAFANRYDDFFPSATAPGYAWFEFDSSGGAAHLLRERRGRDASPSPSLSAR